MILKFDASKEEKEAIIQVGREVAIKFLEKTNIKRERVPRRFSVS